MRKPKPTKLEQKAGAVKALVTIHDLLNQGLFGGFRAETILASVKFIESLHAKALEDLRKTPGSESMFPKQDPRSQFEAPENNVSSENNNE